MVNSGRTAERIYEGAKRAEKIVSEHAYRTPVEYSDALSEMTGGRIFLKLENLQKTGSFKIRGALYKISRVKDDVQGVVTASAGNHAQGVAFASSIFGIPCAVVMPESASITKVESTKKYGAEVILHGRVYDDAEKRAVEISKRNGLAMIHPFDDFDIISGQGTIALEISNQIEDIDEVIVPVGGGGLISGIAGVIKTLNPDIRVVGVEPENSPKFTASLEAGRITNVEIRPTIADGLVTKKPGRTTYEIVRALVDTVITVNEDEIARAIHFLLENEKVLAEGAGAVGVAALLGKKLDANGKNVAVIVSGGNIDLTAIYRLIIRALANSGRLAVIEGYVPDMPGNLSDITGTIAEYRGNIIDVIHQREDLNAPAWHTALRIIFEIQSGEMVARILDDLKSKGYSFRKI